MQLIFNGGQEARFKPYEVNVHNPSEHTINGNHFDLEMQFVHKYSKDDSLGAIVSVFFDIKKGANEENSFIE